MEITEEEFDEARGMLVEEIEDILYRLEGELADDHPVAIHLAFLDYMDVLNQALADPEYTELLISNVQEFLNYLENEEWKERH